MFSKLFVAGLLGLAAAYTKPVGDKPEGNPIALPGSGSIVPVGQPYTIKWEPTTQGTVTLLLLKGPSTNAVPQYPIAENIANSGSYVWTPATDLTPTDGAEGYGIQLIVDATGQYQYTTQFGISNPDNKGGNTPAPYGGSSSSSSSAAAAASTTTAATETPAGYTAPAASSMSTSSFSAYVPVGTGSAAPQPSSNGTAVTLATQTYGATSAPTTTRPVQQTGAAVANAAFSIFGLVAAAGAAVLAY